MALLAINWQRSDPKVALARQAQEAYRHTSMLVGRSSELEALAEVINLVRSEVSASLVIRGAPGVGKTVLLDELENLAYDFRVIRTQGIESELQLGYAALHRIVIPFMDRIPRSPGPQRNAIEAAFGLSATGRPEQFLVGLAALTLLSEPQRTAPLLVVVDDAHWLDQESMTAPAFVGRRLQADRVALVFAVRDSFAHEGLTKGLPELHVTGLADEPARQLLASLTSTPVQDGVAAKIITATVGNPLALTGLAGELTEAQLTGLAPLPDPLPAGELIEARFARQVRASSPGDSDRAPARSRGADEGPRCDRQGGRRARHVPSCTRAR
jgi:AAA ATPase domain